MMLKFNRLVDGDSFVIGLIVSIILAFWLAAKVFRVGILMTGKPPGAKEIFRLLRAPVTRRVTNA